MDLQTVLMNWTREWLESRDVISHKIVSIEQKTPQADSGTVVVHRSDGDQVVKVLPVLKGKWSSEAQCADMVVTLNKRENVQAVVSAWAELVKNEKLLVVFVNPNTKGDQKWVLRPSTHNRIAEASSLRQGLLTMAEQVEEWRG